MKAERDDTELKATPTESEQAVPIPVDSSEPTFPDGGVAAWLVVAGGAMGTFCSFGMIQTFGVFQDYYTLVYLNEHPPSVIAWIGSVQAFLLFAMAIVSGRLFDHGYFRHTLVGGSAIYLVSLFLLSLAKPHHYYQIFLAQGIGMGIGMGLIFLPCVSIAAQYFKRRRGLAVGIILSGAPVGAVVNPLILNHLFNQPSAGFPWAVRTVAFLDLALLGLANIFMRTRLPARPANVDMRAIMRDIPFWFCCAGIAFTFWGLFIPIFYIQLFSVKHNASHKLQASVVAILNAAGVPGRIMPMFLADRWGPFSIIWPVVFLCGCMAFVFLAAGNSDAGLVVFAIVYGWISGAFISLSIPAVASFSRSVSEVGTRIGFMGLTGALAILTGSPISGALLNPPHYTWVWPIVFSGVTIFVGLGMFVVSAWLKKRSLR
ncbi:MFS general substrate transporter [Mycena maculata]|uniref:MFS general substrate transporter n=1 Tax=Mycena maculata TaxID=230809 RepID=A0AAD7NJV9_9AGAR|nr:MFS general substrate transporter [Mycena maculata]